MNRINLCTEAIAQRETRSACERESFFIGGHANDFGGLGMGAVHRGKAVGGIGSKAGEGGYDVGEMEMVLKLGLLCSHSEPESRLGMRHVCQILEGKTPLPEIRWASMNVSIMGELKDGPFGQCHMKESPVLSFFQGETRSIYTTNF